MTKKYVAICVPHHGDPVMDFTKSLAGLFYILGKSEVPAALVEAHASAGAFAARNICMEGVENLEKKGVLVEHLLWIDADMGYPANLYHRLVAHKKDIVGATYVRRSAPYDVLGRGLTGVPQDVSTGLVEMMGMPLGAMLVHRKVFKDFVKPYFRVMMADHELPLGEDYYFCNEARKRGFQVWLDVDLSKEMQHVGRKAYTIGEEEARRDAEALKAAAASKAA